MIRAGCHKTWTLQQFVMRCKRTSQGRFAKATTALFATLVCGVIFILCGLPVEAQNPDSTSGFSLSLNQHQFNFPAMNLWPATRQFDSKSSVNSTFSGINQDLTVDGLFDNLDILPGKAGDIGEKLNFGYQGWKLFSDTRESLQTIKEHPNDPGSDWERASIGLNFYSFLEQPNFSRKRQAALGRWAPSSRRQPRRLAAV